MRRNTWLLPAGVAALVGLLLLLGALQYRWLGQVSEAITTQKRSVLLQRGAALSQALNREITRTYLWFLLTEGQDPEALVSRWQSWRQVGRQTDLVTALYLVLPPDRKSAEQDGSDHWSLARLDGATGKWLSLPWPAAFAGLRPNGGPGPGGHRPRGPPMQETEAGPVLVVPLIGAPTEGRGSRAWVLVQLDQTYLVDVLFPALAAQHLGPSEDDEPVAARLRRRGHPEAVWPVGAALPRAPSGEHAPIIVRGVEPSLIDPALVAGAQPPVLLPRLRGVTPPFLEGMAPPPGERRDRSPRGDGERPGWPGPRARRVAPPFGQATWELSVFYTSGTIADLVAQLRARNLALAIGILAVLAAAIGALGLAFRRANVLAARQREFMASVSHELRTPLAVIGSAAQNLRDGTIAESERVREYGGMIHEESRRLASMVEDVLRATSGLGISEELNLSRVDARAVVAAALEALHLPIRQARARIERVEPEAPVMVKADPQALRQAIENVVGNALKYGGEAPAIEVRVGDTSTPAGPRVQIAVTDRGLGIDEDERRHIFEPFFRGREPLRRQIHGSGLGLSLVWRILKAHGGRVLVESVKGKGSRFTLDLPASGLRSQVEGGRP